MQRISHLEEDKVFGIDSTTQHTCCAIVNVDAQLINSLLRLDGNKERGGVTFDKTAKF